MKRKFNTFSQIQISNKDTEKDFHIPLYQNIKSISETIPPEKKEIFDIGAFGSSAYYYKNTLGMNVEVSDLYYDGDEPTPPVEKKYIYEKGEDSDVDFSLMLSSSWDKVSVGTNLTVGTMYTIYPKVIGEKFDMFISGFSVATYVEEYTFTLTEGMSFNDHVIITVKRHEDRQYIYWKDKDSDVEFELYDSNNNVVKEGTNLEVEGQYTILSGESSSFYINGIELGYNHYQEIFILGSDMHHDNKVIIKVMEYHEPTSDCTYIKNYESSNVEFDLWDNAGYRTKISSGDGIMIGGEYRIANTNNHKSDLSENSDIYFNKTLVVSDVNSYNFKLDNNMIIGGELVIKVVSHDTTPNI